MIQLVFDAAEPKEALDEEPVEVGYSAHEGALRSTWDDDKLEVVDGTHPVVYPAAGSHANKYSTRALARQLGRGRSGLRRHARAAHGAPPPGRDDPERPGRREGGVPWIAFEGRWGELQKAFFNGPTGPNLKTQWTQPITWSEGWRDRSYAVPTGGLFGTSTTDFFCSAVEHGLARRSSDSCATRSATSSFSRAILGLAIFAAARATWTPSRPLRIAPAPHVGPDPLRLGTDVREAGPLSSSGSGVLLIPIAFVITLAAVAPARVIDARRHRHGRGGRRLGVPRRRRSGRRSRCSGSGSSRPRPRARSSSSTRVARSGRSTPIGSRCGGSGRSSARSRSSSRRLGRPDDDASSSSRSRSGSPSAGRSLAPVVELEDRRPFPALRRSGALVRRRWIRVGSLVGVERCARALRRAAARRASSSS